jgi:hypothetical protein
MATRNEQLELSEVPADRETQVHLTPLPSPQQRRTILISLGCGILQLPIWGVQLLESSPQSRNETLTKNQAWQ